MGRTESCSAVCIFLFCLLGSTLQVVSASSGKDATATIEATIDPILAVPADNHVQKAFFAVGDQIYKYNGSAWALNNVSADLYNSKGFKVAHHFFLAEPDSEGGQASWETFHPFSLVTGKPIENVPKNDTIPWLLLEATNSIGSKKLFGSVTFIQRLYTQHGLAPSADIAAKKGEIFKSSYAALYTFST